MLGELRWHRDLFKLVWRRKSRTTRREPRIPQETIDLIRKMAAENTWGAERIRGELFKLGILFSKRTIQRHLRGVRVPKKPPQDWKVAKGSGITILKTAFKAPLMNSICERFLGSVRRECLDHILILGEDHLRGVLREYVRYVVDSRPHQGLEQRTPGQMSRGEDLGNEFPNATGQVVSIPVLGGLHHEYRRAA